jgi:hypothetical protein
MGKSRFDTARLVVEVKQRLSDGALFTSHRYATPGDKNRASKWPSGGLVQVAHALLIEYLRREAYVMAITMISQGRDPKGITTRDLEERVKMQIIKMVDQFSEGAVEEALQRINSQG